MPEKYFVITNNEIVRLRYILVYSRNERNTSNIKVNQHRNPIIKWMLEHKSLTAMFFYAIILLAIGFNNSHNGYYFRQFVSRITNTLFENIRNINLFGINNLFKLFQ